MNVPLVIGRGGAVIKISHFCHFQNIAEMHKRAVGNSSQSAMSPPRFVVDSFCLSNVILKVNDWWSEST
jgi:hypothetical protein